MKTQKRPAKEPVYTIGYEPAILDAMRVRTADRWAAFLLPHLRAGMTLLDCGCGPGTITLGLAEAVAPGEAIGIDREQSQVEIARCHAKEACCKNLRFEVGDASQLRFPDNTFDVVYAHSLLIHVPEPLRVLREMHRVLKHGGIVAVRDTLIDAWFVTGPDDSLLEEAFNLVQRAALVHGGDWNRGKHLGPLLVETGFERVTPSAAYLFPRNRDELQSMSHILAGMINESGIAQVILDQGLASREQLDRIVSACRTLADQPSGFFAIAEGEALGWKA